MIDPIGESECGHSFHVFWPTVLEFGQGLRRCRGAQLLASFKVP
jgi:hypothetical protein